MATYRGGEGPGVATCTVPEESHGECGWVAVLGMPAASRDGIVASCGAAEQPQASSCRARNPTKEPPYKAPAEGEMVERLPVGLLRVQQLPFNRS